MWQGSLFDRMVLQGDDAAEQRIQRLRENLLKRPQGKRGYLSIERATLLTDSYQQTEGEAAILRKAKGFRHICEHISIPYQDGQLIMGNPTAVVPGTEVEPEFMANWLDRNVYCEEAEATISEIEALKIRGVDAWVVADEDIKTLKEYILPNWRGIGHDHVVQRQLEENFPEVNFKDGHFVGRMSYPIVGFALNHTVADYVSVLRRGLKQIKKEIRAEMENIDGSDVPATSEFDRYNVYKGCLIAADAIVIYANRCADMAAEMVTKETDPTRKAEFTEMARICRKVPEYPAESWWEAIQCWHFLHMAINLCDGGVSHSAGRFDQYMYYYLEKDIKDSVITRQQAQELLECLFLKIRQRLYLFEYRGAKRIVSMRTNDKMTIGGVDSNGCDATNDLTFMCLEAHCHCHLDEPVLSFRIHKNTPDDILKAVLETIRLGTGIPHILNDEALVPSFMNRGVPLSEARHYADIGCQENVTDPNLCGADTSHPNTGFNNMAKYIEYALHDGIDMMSGKQCGPQTGDPRKFKSMDDFFDAVVAQMKFAVRVTAVYNNLMTWGFARFHPVPVFNLLHPTPRRTGIDYSDGGCKYNWTGAEGVGLGTAVDSLTAVDYLVFNKKLVTMDQLIEAMDNNWVGYDDIRQKCHAAPKYGNDDDAADKWLVRLTNVYADEWEKHRTSHGGTFVPAFYSMTTYVWIGNETGATPNGRGRGEPLSDAMSPSQGVDLEGPTRLHKSGAKIDTFRTIGGVAFNCRFTAAAVAGDREVSKWADLLRTYVLLRGQSVQYTIVDNESLKAAQKNPDEYRDLIVRTGGYSAFFVELDKETQDSIISRTEHSV